MTSILLNHRVSSTEGEENLGPIVIYYLMNRRAFNACISVGESLHLKNSNNVPFVLPVMRELLHSADDEHYKKTIQPSILTRVKDHSRHRHWQRKKRAGLQFFMKSLESHRKKKSPCLPLIGLTGGHREISGTEATNRRGEITLK